ncbi:MAG: hypothetical protein II642_07620 [Firmicutes bacterium]|nr:hypothetical protein [Bacillota bacterium]
MELYRTTFIIPQKPSKCNRIQLKHRKTQYIDL